jgi:hypothetical protein
VSLTEPEKIQNCTSCGKPGANNLAPEFDNAVLCEDCAERLQAAQAGEVPSWKAHGHWVSTEEPPPPPEPPEDRFAELFKAARALFETARTAEDRNEDLIIDEDVVCPTLVFANEIGQNMELADAKERLVVTWNDDDGGRAWREERDNFARKYKGFKPMKVVDGALLLELQPAYAVVRNYRTIDMPKEVEIRVYPRAKQASAEDVAEAYEKALSDAGLLCDVSHRIHLIADGSGGLLWLLVGNGEELPDEHALSVAPLLWQDERPRFPVPRLIGAIYEPLYGNVTEDKPGFAHHLNMRPTSESPEIHNLIPPCLAVILREYGWLKWAEVYDLLNQYVLGDYHPRGKIPDASHDPLGGVADLESRKQYDSRTRQLRDQVKSLELKSRLPLLAHWLYRSVE